MALRALGGNLSKITRPALARHGAAFAALITEWANAVGPSLAEQSLPERLSRPATKSAETGGVLTVRVSGGGAAMEMQHQHEQIVERINSYLGFRAVTRLSIKQAPLPVVSRRAAPPAQRPVPAAARQQITATIAAIEDPDLKAALERLGSALAAAVDDKKRS